MSAITGREVLAAIKLAATWGTPVACEPGDGIKITSELFTMDQEVIQDDSANQMYISKVDLGKPTAKGSLDMYMRYNQLDFLFALIMGAAGTPAQQGETAAYTNSYTLADKLTKFATVAFKKKSDKIWEFPSWMPSSLKFAGEMNKPTTLSLEGIADQRVLNSTTNTITTIASAIVGEAENRILFNGDTVFRLNDQSGDALAAGNVIKPSSFEFNFNRQLDADSFVAGSRFAQQPVDNGFPSASLSLNFPQYNDDNHGYFEDFDAVTPKKMDITFTGNTIEDSYKYEFKLTFPHLVLKMPEASMSGPGKIPMTLSMDALGAESAPAGMTGILNPFQVDVQNTRTVSPLA